MIEVVAHAMLAVPTLSPTRRLAERLVDVSRGWRALASVGVFAAVVALWLPRQAETARAYSEGVGAPDSSFWYRPDQLMAWAAAYGPDGRHAYVLARATFDVVWPLVYAAMLVLVLGWLLQRTTQEGSPWRLVVLLPVAALLCDYGENLCAGVVMARYPDATPLLAALAPVFTALKWSTLGAAFLAVPAVAVAGLVGRGRRRT